MTGWVKPHHVVTARRLCDEAVQARGALMDCFARGGLAMTGWIKPTTSSLRAGFAARQSRHDRPDGLLRPRRPRNDGLDKTHHVVTARRLCDPGLAPGSSPWRGCPDGSLPGTRPGPEAARERGCPFREGLCTQQARSDLVLLLRAEARKYAGASPRRLLRGQIRRSRNQSPIKVSRSGP